MGVFWWSEEYVGNEVCFTIYLNLGNQSGWLGKNSKGWSKTKTRIYPAGDSITSKNLVVCPQQIYHLSMIKDESIPERK